MGKDLFDKLPVAKDLFLKADEVLGFKITEIMFNGSEEDLKQTKVTQPAVFLHSVISVLSQIEKFDAQAVAGHSLGEFSALVVSGALSFEDGLTLVYKRALAMQKCCEMQQSAMAAVLGLDADVIENICSQSTTDNSIVVAANYNCPGQIVISGSVEAVDRATSSLEAAGARRVVKLPVSGAFHSPLMQPAKDELQQAIASVSFKDPVCPVFQNVDASSHTSAAEIKNNLIAQLTSPVRWTSTVENMLAYGIDEFVEAGPGNVLQGLIKKVDKKINVSHLPEC